MVLVIVSLSLVQDHFASTFIALSFLNLVLKKIKLNSSRVRKHVIAVVEFPLSFTGDLKL